jgi:hypothetical protein
MPGEPELIIGYDDESRPVAGVCSACGEEMPKCEPHMTTASEIIRWFSTQFVFHVGRKHRQQAPETVP